MKTVAYTFNTQPILTEGLKEMVVKTYDLDDCYVVEFEVEDGEEQEMLEDELREEGLSFDLSFEEI